MVGSNIILAAQDGKVWSINTDNNIKKLVVDLGVKIQTSSKIKIAAALSYNQDNIYVHTQDNKLYAVNVISSEVRIWNSEKDSWQESK